MPITLDCTVITDERLHKHEEPGGLIELEDTQTLPRAGAVTIFTDDEGTEWRCRVTSVERDPFDARLRRGFVDDGERYFVKLTPLDLPVGEPMPPHEGEPLDWEKYVVRDDKDDAERRVA